MIMADGIPTEKLFSSITEWLDAVGPMLGAWVGFSLTISIAVYLYQIIKKHLRDPESNAPKTPPVQPAPININLDAFWRALYPLMGWGSYQPEKPKNDDKPKNDELLGFDDEGEMVFTSDFENEAGAAEWLKSRGMEDEP